MKSTYNITNKNGGVFSKIEMNFYEYLLSKFDENDIFPQYYNKELYPFNCDFYINSLKIFIEIQGNWTHGGHPFDKNNKDDIDKLNYWKSKNSDYYRSAIDVWTNRDVIKRNTAKENNINYLEIYSKDINIAINEFETFLNNYYKNKKTI